MVSPPGRLLALSSPTRTFLRRGEYLPNRLVRAIIYTKRGLGIYHFCVSAFKSISMISRLRRHNPCRSLSPKGESPTNEKLKHKDWRCDFDARFHIRHISRVRDDGSGAE